MFDFDKLTEEVEISLLSKKLNPYMELSGFDFEKKG